MKMRDGAARLIRLNATRQKAGGVATSTIYDWMNREGFPKPIRIGVRAVAWVESEVDDWIAQRIAERDSATTAEGATA